MDRSNSWQCCSHNSDRKPQLSAHGMQAYMASMAVCSQERHEVMLACSVLAPFISFWNWAQPMLPDAACCCVQLKQEVESLLQRTDSILSRSSGHSTLHGASSGAHLPG
jgi:hypothetical protein